MEKEYLINPQCHPDKHRYIFAHIDGKGQPPVIFISGYPDRGDASWEIPPPGIFLPISEFATVLDYDRPGTIKIIDDQLIESRSDPVKQPVTAKDHVKDLHALIDAAKIKKPFIIVAHSAGGLAARLYAFKYPKEVCGLLLIDVTDEKLLKTWTKTEIKVFDFSTKFSNESLKANYRDVEIIDFHKSFEQLEKYKHQKLHIPAIILSSTKVPNAEQLIKEGSWPKFATQKMAESIVKGIQKSHDLIAKSFIPTAKRINVKDSGHYIHKERPELIIKLIHDLVEQHQNSIICK